METWNQRKDFLLFTFPSVSYKHISPHFCQYWVLWILKFLPIDWAKNVILLEIFQLQLLPEPHFVRFRFGWFSMTHLKYFKTFKDLIPDNHVIQLRWRKHWHFIGGKGWTGTANVSLCFGCSALIRNLLYFQSNSSLSQSESQDMWKLVMPGHRCPSSLASLL